MSSRSHATVPVQVWADVDAGVAEVVRALNRLPGVRTHASCQGTIGDGGPAPYGPYVAVSWTDDRALARLRDFGAVVIDGDGHGSLMLHQEPVGSPA